MEFNWRRPTELLTPDEIMARADERLLRKLRENAVFERKPSGIHAADLGDYFVIFANSPPAGGVIAIGVGDNGSLDGCRMLSTKQLNQLEQARDTYCPDAIYETRRVSFTREDGSEDFVLLFRVHYRETKVVKNAKGEVHTRKGDRKRKLSDEEVRELQIAKGEVTDELEACSQLTYPDDFDVDLVRQFVASYSQSHDLSLTLNEAEILELRHLGKRGPRGFVPNKACALLFAKDPAGVVAGARIRFLRFDGEQEGVGEKFNAIRDDMIEAPLPNLIVRAADVIRSQLRMFSALGPDGKFYTASEYPEVAWYEAIVNACVHRSYGLRNMNIFVKMFDDRLVIESPGGFPGIVNPENIYETQHPRNPYLMDAMFYLRFVKQAREGTRRMRDTMTSMNLPVPEFAQRSDAYHQVRVTLRNNIKQRRVWLDSDAAALVGEAIFKSLKEDEKRVINFAAEHGRINVSQVQRLTSIRSWPAAKKLLLSLVNRGIFEHEIREDMDRDPKACFRLRSR